MTRLVFTTLVAAMTFADVIGAQLPAVSWTCPMHPDALEDKKGPCAVCGMSLEPVRLVTLFACPVHAIIEQTTAGTCRICKRELVQRTAALTFTCDGRRDIQAIEPGTCPGGGAMIRRYTLRAHGDHNPKHGGIFFMAPDNWHHLEGTLPAAGRFRVYVYDDYSRPLSAEKYREVRGRVVTREGFDANAGAVRELTSVPLALARNRQYFEARIDGLQLPAKVTAKLSFGADGKESRFDFVFPTYTTEHASTSAPRATVDKSTAAPSATVDKPVAPVNLSGLEVLKSKQEEVAALMERGSLAGIYVPALQAKDAALSIQAGFHGPAAAQDAVETHVKQVVLNAYRLDAFGDAGDGTQAREAFAAFSAAIAALDALVAGRR